MAYKVINKFIDKEDNDTFYNVGDEYPKGDYEPSNDRIEELSKQHPKYKTAFIEVEETDEEKAAREAKEVEEKTADEDEKNAIRAELESLGISVHPNTGLEKLREKLEEAKAEKENKE